MSVPDARPSRTSIAEPEQLRLLARVARMYHERGMRQPQIATELHLSQPRVSRLLKQAVELGIVRTVVTLPSGVYTDLEDEVQQRYGLRDVVVVDTGGAGDEVMPALGAATAQYLDVTLTGGDVLGISSWSKTVIAAVEAMRPKNSPVVSEVVQLVGGVGEPGVQVQAARLTSRLAQLTGARPVFMPTPGLVSNPAVRRALLKDASVRAVTEAWTRLTMVVVGIGSFEPSALLRRGGNASAEADERDLRGLGAVGDVCYRFFGSSGQVLRSALDQRVVGINPKELQHVERRIGVAGGERKFAAIRAALRGGWINVLITDRAIAQRLVSKPE